MRKSFVSSLAAISLIIALSVVAKAGPVGPPSGPPYIPDDVILNKSTAQPNKTFNLSSATVDNMIVSTISASKAIFIGGVAVSTSITSGTSVYPATGTPSFPRGFSASTGTFTGTITGTTITITGIFNGTTIHGSSAVITGTITGSNLTGSNSGDVTIGTANGLTLAGQALSLATSGTTSTGSLTAVSYNTFNNKLSTTGNGSGLTGLTKAQVGLDNVENVDQTDAANITTGTIGTARLGSGTASSQRYLRGDQSWQLLNSTAVGLGSVTNNAQVKIADYTQKGAILVGIGTGTFSVLAPQINNWFLRTNSAKAEGVEWIPISSVTFSGGITASTGTFTEWVTSPLATFSTMVSTFATISTATISHVSATTTDTDELSIGSLSGVLKAAAGDVSGSATTSDVPEGSNLYFTTARSTGSISATSPVVFTNGVISIATAGVTSTGSLVSTDWNTFNNKLSTTSAASTYLTLSSAAATYINISASNTYVSASSASVTYLSTITAAATYLANSSATATYLQKSGGVASNFTVTSGSITVSSATIGTLTWSTTNYAQKYPLMKNIQDYGAIPNDGIDDTNAITAALAASQYLYAPVGDYINNATHTIVNQFLMGDGKEKTIFRRTSGGSAHFIVTGAGQLSGMSLDGGSLSGAVLISSGSQRSEFKQIYFKNVASPSYAFIFWTGDNEWITNEDLEFHDCYGFMWWQTLYYTSFYRTKMYSNLGGYAINLTSTSIAHGITDIMSRDTYYEGTSKGIFANGVSGVRDVTFDGLRVRINSMAEPWYQSYFAGAGGEVAQISFKNASFLKVVASTIPFIDTNNFQLFTENMHFVDNTSTNWPVMRDRGTSQMRMQDWTMESTNPWLLFTADSDGGTGMIADNVNYTQGVIGTATWSSQVTPGGVGNSSFNTIRNSNLNHSIANTTTKGGFIFDQIFGNIDLTNTYGPVWITNSSGTITDPNKSVVGTVISSVAASGSVGATGTLFDAAALPLHPGSYLLSGVINYSYNGAVFSDVSTRIGVGGTTAGNSAAGLTAGDNYIVNIAGISTATYQGNGLTLSNYPVSPTTDTTYYLKGFMGSYSGSTPTFTGALRAIKTK